MTVFMAYTFTLVERRGHFVKVAFHEGLVLNSRLVGMMKCGNCGYAMHTNHSTGRRGQLYRNFYDCGRR